MAVDDKTCRINIQVQSDDFDLGSEYSRLRHQADNPGAIVSFIGLVRDFIGEGTEGEQSLTLEHYPGMTEKALQDIADRACSRWPLSGCTIIHRVGKLVPSEQIVAVLVASSHRDAAFSGAEFIMDYLKTEAPFWKKQQAGDQAEWVVSRASDYQRASRWKNSKH
ncbi:molybdopterin guanine dinucleotide biosynthesis protein MoaE [Pseudohongiella nitratireducens]|uniref:Molybdopterin synthase catalytic subunit n=1 Tax=Pseudohongiella nitratireducens TaxID=1768907 RepID=A0A917GJX1_9GAMM|nr:molybdenum cofactor biosynthesis protein MoaE [Pseudohongiella nitratireducens]MDF1622824.1 molybdenum cofactor biosynthesis protein MoaE [Pseudohongiella nitratireducens]GGG49365.1 molybdopterin guanine dinucleotide biosynthesis protein MoaE [Pseudohongiella nitratireducens]